MLMIYELDVLQSDCHRLGDPAPLTPADIIGNPVATTNAVRRTSQEQLVSLDALTPFLTKSVMIDDHVDKREFFRLDGRSKSVLLPRLPFEAMPMSEVQASCSVVI